MVVVGVSMVDSSVLSEPMLCTEELLALDAESLEAVEFCLWFKVIIAGFV